MQEDSSADFFSLKTINRVTQTVYNNNDNNNQQQAQAVQNNGPRAVARLPTRVMASVGLGMFAVVGGMVWL